MESAVARTRGPSGNDQSTRPVKRLVVPGCGGAVAGGAVAGGAVAGGAARVSSAFTSSFEVSFAPSTKTLPQSSWKPDTSAAPWTVIGAAGSESDPPNERSH